MPIAKRRESAILLGALGGERQESKTKMTDTIRKMLVAAVVQKVESAPLTDVAEIAAFIDRRAASKSGSHRISAPPENDDRAAESRRGLSVTVHRTPLPDSVPASVLAVCSASPLTRIEIVPAVHRARKRRKLPNTTDGTIESAINRMTSAGMLERTGPYGNYSFQTHVKFRT